MSDNVTENDQQFITEDVEGSNKDESEQLRSAGTVWATSANIITAFIGFEVLSLAWAIAQLGWVIGPLVIVLFSFVTYYTSCLLASCNYHLGDPIQNFTCMEVVQNTLGGFKRNMCVFIQYANLIGIAIGYTIAASTSMRAIKRSICFHEKGHDNPCKVSGTLYMLIFGGLEILLSQIPDFDQISWISVVANVMSLTYSIIGLGLGIAKVAENGEVKGSLTGIISIRNLTPTQKIWNVFQAFGAIAFAYSYSQVLIEIKHTVKAPIEHKTNKKARMISLVTTTIFYTLCGCFGYAAFGDMTPENLLTGFGFFDPYWLVDIANVAVVIHLVLAYQVSCRPFFVFVDSTAVKSFPQSKFINNNIEIPISIGGYKPLKLNMFQLLWKSAFVCVTTLIASLMSFFNDVVGIIGAFGFWPLIVYVPIKIYMVQKKIPRWSARWILLQILNVVCLIISVCAAIGSIAGVVSDLKNYKPFKTM